MTMYKYWETPILNIFFCEQGKDWTEDGTYRNSTLKSDAFNVVTP